MLGLSYWIINGLHSSEWVGHECLGYWVMVTVATSNEQEQGSCILILLHRQAGLFCFLTISDYIFFIVPYVHRRLSLFNIFSWLIRRESGRDFLNCVLCHHFKQKVWVVLWFYSWVWQLPSMSKENGCKRFLKLEAWQIGEGTSLHTGERVRSSVQTRAPLDCVESYWAGR